MRISLPIVTSFLAGVSSENPPYVGRPLTKNEALVAAIRAAINRAKGWDNLSAIRRQYGEDQWNELYPHFKEEYENKLGLFNSGITFETNRPGDTLNTDAMDRQLIDTVRRQIHRSTNIAGVDGIVKAFKENSASRGLEEQQLAALEDLINESANKRKLQLTQGDNNHISANIPG